jgi:hypothetical protein
MVPVAPIITDITLVLHSVIIITIIIITIIIIIIILTISTEYQH